MVKCFIIIFLFLASLSSAIVSHPDGEPSPLWSDRPPNAVLAKVGSCSGVVIHPNYVLSADHCGFTSVTPVIINGVTYYSTYFRSHYYRGDLVLIRIDDELENFIPIPEYDILGSEEDKDPNDQDFNVVVGGYGAIRGEAVYATYDSNVLVGYRWNTPYGTLTWGTNNIRGHNMARAYMLFDELFSTPYESALAVYDSGCGCFMYRDGLWWTIGIGKSVTDYGYDYFKHPSDPGRDYGTQNTINRVYSMSGWINSVIYGSDMNKDGSIDEEDLVLFLEDWLVVDNPDHPNILNYYHRYNSRSDLNQDGRVNLHDFAIFAKDWNN